MGEPLDFPIDHSAFQPLVQVALAGLIERYSIDRQTMALHGFIVYDRFEEDYSRAWIPLREVRPAVMTTFLRMLPDSTVREIVRRVAAESQQPYVARFAHYDLGLQIIVPPPGHPSHDARLARTTPSFSGKLSPIESFIINKPREHYRAYVDSEVLSSCFENVDLQRLHEALVRTTRNARP